MTLLAGVLQSFFVQRLERQRGASSNTIASYRDTFRLLLRFAQEQLKKPPSDLVLAELDAPFIASFLCHLETDRRNSVRTRNARLAAIHSFARFASLQEPADSAICQRILSIPTKRAERKLVTSLSSSEVGAVLAAPDRSTWLGRRDHAMLLLCVQTGLRVSELVGLRGQDLVLTTGAHVRCLGKGRKERCTPLTRDVVRVLKVWRSEHDGRPDQPVFPSRRGSALSRDAVERLLSKYVKQANASCKSLRTKRVTPHVLRHTTAVTLLNAGNDRSVIALWLGHESLQTTQIYLDADLAMKERALARAAPTRSPPGRFRPTDSLLGFLNGL